MKSKLLSIIYLLVITQNSQAAEQIIPTDASGNRLWKEEHFTNKK